MQAPLIPILFAVVLASSTYAAEGIQLETRVFHATKTQRGGTSTSYLEGKELSSSKVKPDYDTTAGSGIALVYSLNENIDLGLGFANASYHPDPAIRTRDQSLGSFARLFLQRGEGSKLYLQTGVSERRLIERFTGRLTGTQSRADPLVNYDLGLGASLNIGGIDFGIGYKYSNTLIPGRYRSFMTLSDGKHKTVLTNSRLEGHEASLTLAFKI